MNIPHSESNHISKTFQYNHEIDVFDEIDEIIKAEINNELNSHKSSEIITENNIENCENGNEYNGKKNGNNFLNVKRSRENNIDSENNYGSYSL